jgi:hypothetical protein
MKKLTFIAALFLTLLLQSCYVGIHGGHRGDDHHDEGHHDEGHHEGGDRH